MDKLQETTAEGLAGRMETIAAKITELAEALTADQFWAKPFAFGNSVGHLLLHLTGNLNYYIGAQIAGTGYVRDRPREFAENERLAKEDVTGKFKAAVEMAERTVRAQTSEQWSQAYSATGADYAKNRFDMALACISHMDHHLGQVQYLVFALRKS